MSLRKLLLCAALGISLTAFCSAEKIRMAVFQLEPFMMAGDDQQATGVTVDLWKKYIAPKMGVDVEVVGPLPILRVTQMLKSGEVDTVSQLTKIPEREAAFLYPETAITEIASCIVVDQDSPIKEITKPEDLYGKRLGFMEAASIPPFVKSDKIPIELVAAQDFRTVNFNKLFAKHIDAVLDINYASMMYTIKQKGLKDKVRVIMLPSTPMKVYSIFQRSQKGERLMKAFDKAMAEIKKTDAFEQLSKNYLE